MTILLRLPPFDRPVGRSFHSMLAKTLNRCIERPSRCILYQQTNENVSQAIYRICARQDVSSIQITQRKWTGSKPAHVQLKWSMPHLHF